MSPHIAVDERLRRLAPIVTGAAGFGVAVLRMRGGGMTERELVVAAALGLGGALVAHAIATVRGTTGVIAGAVAGVWLAATAAAAAHASAHAGADAGAHADAGAFAAAGVDVNGAVALALAALVAMLVARADKVDTAPPILTVPVAVALVVMEPRAWALAAVAAGVIAWRDAGRRRWLAAAPGVAAIAGGVLTLLATMGRAPAWAPELVRIDARVWLEGAVDGLGPVAIVVGAIGAVLAVSDRRARWTAAVIVGALAAGFPLTTSTPGAALVGVALALGVTLASVGARVGRIRDQALVGVALAAVLVVQMLI